MRGVRVGGVCVRACVCGWYVCKAAAGAAGGEGNTLNGVADRLTQIADSVQITTDDIESDGTEDQHGGSLSHSQQ